MQSKMKPILKKKVKCIVKDGQVTVTSLCSASEPSYRDMIQNPESEGEAGVARFQGLRREAPAFAEAAGWSQRGRMGAPRGDP